MTFTFDSRVITIFLSRHDLVVCLSKKIRDAVIGEEEHVISDTCRKHLKIEKEIEVSL